jgi:hypothetical protein
MTHPEHPPKSTRAGRSRTIGTGFFAMLANVFGAKGTGAGGRAVVTRSTGAFVVGMICVFTLGLTSSAFAASPEPPELHAEPVFATTATFKGVLNPRGSTEGGEYQFVYREGKTCKGAGEKKSPATLTGYPGAEPEAREVTVTGLTPSKEYTACLVAKNGEGEASSTPVTFTTTAAGAPEAPEVAVESVKASEVTFHGVLNPAASEMVEAGTYRFVYRKSSASEDKCEGSGQVTTSSDIAMGFPHEEVFEPITGLSAGKEYAVCVIATRDDGKTEKSVPVPFTTATPPEKPETKEPAADITATTAELEGTLNPGSTREVGGYFAFSEPGGSNCTEGPTVGLEEFEGEQEVPATLVHAALANLQPHQKYVFCLVATNSAGETTVGNSVSFETLVSPLTIAGESASEVKSTSATLNAQINPNNVATTYQFEYATNEALSENLVKPTSGPPLTGYGEQTASVPTGALTPGTTYYYRAVAENVAHEKVMGKVQPFTTVPQPFTDPVSEISASTATFNGHFTLDPVATTYSFDYKANSGTECEESSTTAVNAGTGSATVSEATQATGLAPSTEYGVCLVTSNEFGFEVSPPTPVVTFTTPAVGPPAAIAGGDDATEVTGTSATLHAEVDPNGAGTRYAFEYGTSSVSEHATPQAALGASDDSAHPVDVEIQGLTAGTKYEYRVVATNEAGGKANTVAGPESSFTTQATGGKLVLPDNRQWQLVSPPNKEGAVIEPITIYGVIQSSAEGGAFTYVASAPTESQPQGYANAAQVLSTRGPDGWSSKDIATPNDAPDDVAYGGGQEYRFFSSDLSRALVEPHLFTPFTGEETLPHASENTPYLREDATCQATPATCYTPLLNDEDVTSGAKFGGEYSPNTPDHESFVGATPDLSHIVISVHDVPVLKTPEATSDGLYEWAGGHLQLVSVLPADEGGGPSGLASLGGNGGSGSGESERRNAISDDGSRIIWSETHIGGGLYMRDAASEETVRLDAVQAGSGKLVDRGRQPRFDMASSDGSTVFFTDNQELTANSRTGKNHATGQEEEDLYACHMVEVAGKLKCDLSDLSVDSNPDGERAAVQGGVLDASEDGSYVYFVADGVLGDGAEKGAKLGTCSERAEAFESKSCNLYVEHYDEATSSWEAPKFIAALSGADFDDWVWDHLKIHTSRSSPDGRYLAFMSERSLTGYDNTDVSEAETETEVESGVETKVHHDEEVYEYDVETGKLVCASCNPTGARPDGEEYETPEGRGTEHENMRLAGGYLVWPDSQWLAANVPGWTPYTSFSSSLHQSRYLSNSGRLFFNSHEALVPQDVNGTWDVYEYEPPGNGSCVGTASTFHPGIDGCTSLISSGEGSEESAFLDASESGGDVFFLTASQLVPQDVDHSLDVYDAHECTGESPCLPASAEVPGPCTTEASCRPAPTPQPSLYGTPPSATFNGAGNLAPPAPALLGKPKPKLAKCAKGKARKKGSRTCLDFRPFTRRQIR